MRRGRLYAFLLLLGTGLAGLATQVLGQADSSPQRPGVIIASSHPASADAAPEPEPIPNRTPTSSINNDGAPRFPRAASQPVDPVVPVPDDNSSSPSRRTGSRRLQLRDLANGVQAPSESTGPILTVPAATPARAIQPVVFHVPSAPARPEVAGSPMENRSTPGALSPRLQATALPANRGPGPDGPQTARLTLDVQGAGTAVPGRPYTYEIIVRNDGPAKTEDLQLTETLSPGARYLQMDPPPARESDALRWDLGVLPAGGERRVRVQVLPPDQGEVISQARAVFAVSAGLRARVSSNSASYRSSPSPLLNVTAVCAEPAPLGGRARLKITVSNPGSYAVNRLKLQAQLPDGLDHPSGRAIEAETGPLSAGESRTFNLDLNVLAAGRHTVPVSVAADGGTPMVAEAQVEVLEPTLGLEVKGPGRLMANQEAEYRVEVSNPGMGMMRNVVVTAALPLGVEWAGGADGRYQAATRTVEWNLSLLSAGRTEALPLRVKAGGGAGEKVLQMMAATESGTTARAATPIVVEGGAGMTLDVTARDAQIEAGAETVVEIKVINQGSTPCTHAGVIVMVPEGLQATKADGPTVNRPRKNQVTFEPLESLAAHGEALYRVQVKGVRIGEGRIRVQLSCDQLHHEITREVGVEVYRD